MATPKKVTTHKAKPHQMQTSMNIWLTEVDVANIRRIAVAHNLSKAAAIRLAILHLCAQLDKDESKPLLPAVGS